jgi:hypothetical protein
MPKFAKVLGSVPASSDYNDTVESEGRQIKQCSNKVFLKKKKKNSVFNSFRLAGGPGAAGYPIYLKGGEWGGGGGGGRDYGKFL